MSEDRDDDLGFGFERTSKVARIGVDVVDDDGLAAGRRRATNALIERDAGMGRHGALEGAEDEDVAVALPFEHIKTNPIVTSELGVEESDDTLHQRVSRASGRGESVERENQSGMLRLSCSHGNSRTQLALRGQMKAKRL